MSRPAEKIAAPPGNGSDTAKRWPHFRDDLEVFPRVGKGTGGARAFLVRDPRNGAAFDLGEREFFLCGQLDGDTPPEAIRSKFKERFDRVIPKEELDAFVRVLHRQGLLAPNGVPAFPDGYLPQPGVLIDAPAWIDTDAVFDWITASLRWCFTRTFVFFATAFTGLGAGVLIRYRRDYMWEWNRLVEGSFPFLLVAAAVFFMMFVQRASAAVACKYAGGRVRWFGVKLFWYLVPVFQCDLRDTALMWNKRNRYRTIYIGFFAQVLAATAFLIGWNITSSQTMLHSILLVFATVFIVFLPWNPLGLRNAYYLLSAWLEIPDLRSRSMNAVWSWLLRQPPLEPLSGRRKWGFLLYGLGTLVFYGFLFSLIAYKALGFLSAHVDPTGTALIMVAGAFVLEFPLRKELMRFDPIYPWLVKNDGKSALGWTIRLGIISLLLLVMLLPYPYEPGGALRILPSNQLGVRARVQGKIVEVLVEEGEWIEEGQLIARLDARETSKNIEIAEAELASAKAQLKLLEAGRKPEEIAKAREGLATAERELFYATREAQRLSKLHAEKVVSLGLYEQALEKRDVSKEIFDSAKENLNLIKSGTRREALDAQEAEVARLEATLKHYNEDMALTEIRSPVQGRVVTPRIKQRVGMEVIVGDLVAIVEDTRSLLADLEVPEKTAGEIKPGARVKVKAWAYPNKTFIGRVADVAPVVADKGKQGTIAYLATEREDALSRAATSDRGRVVRARVELPNPKGLLKSEMTGYGKIFTRYEPFGLVMTHGLIRFFKIEVWSWIP